MADAILRAAGGAESSRREVSDADLGALADDAALSAALAEFDAKLLAFQTAVLEEQALEAQSNVAAADPAGADFLDAQKREPSRGGSPANDAVITVSPTDAWGQILQHDARVDEADTDDAPAPRRELSTDAEVQAVVEQAALGDDGTPVGAEAEPPGASDCVAAGQIMASRAAPPAPGDFIADNDDALLCQLDVGLANAIRVRRRLTMKSIRELLAEQKVAAALSCAATAVDASARPRKRAWWRLGL